MTARDCEVREPCRHGFHILLAREAPRFAACPDEVNFVGVPRAVHVDCYAGTSPCADPVPKLNVQVTAMYVLALLAAE